MTNGGKGLSIRGLSCYPFYYLILRLNSYQSAARTAVDRGSLIDRLKHRQTFIKYKSNGRHYARVYFLNAAEDAIYYFSRKHKAQREACRRPYSFTSQFDK